MTREVSATIETAVGSDFTAPSFLVYADLGSPVYWSTAGTVEWNSLTWSPVGLSVENPSSDSPRLRIRNDNNIGSALVLNNILRDTLFKIYAYYDGDAQEIFRGYGGGSLIDVMDVVIDLFSNRSENSLVPKMRIAKPLFTNLPVAGTVIRWGNDELKVTI